MIDTLPLLIGALLANNFAVAHFFGGCPFFGAGGRIENLKLLGVSNVVVLTLSALPMRPIDQLVLSPFDLRYLHFVVSIVLVAALVQFADIFIRARHPATHRMFGVNLQLNSIGCGIFGMTLLDAARPAGFFAAFFGALGIAAGFTLLIAMFAALRARLDETEVPIAFRGTPIALIVIGLTALAFMGFQGVGS
jgi:Na+-translocating ferredoxin:NAD+ oxidoreductase subunit A